MSFITIPCPRVMKGNISNLIIEESCLCAIREHTDAEGTRHTEVFVGNDWIEVIPSADEIKTMIKPEEDAEWLHTLLP
jgi:hypothetical protein